MQLRGPYVATCIFNSLSSFVSAGIVCSVLCVMCSVCVRVCLNFFRVPWQAQTARPDAKDQADGDYEDSWNWGCYSCMHSFMESWAVTALSEIG